MHFVKAFEVVAYTYRADVYCAECVLGAVIEAIDATGVVFGGAVHLPWETTEDALDRLARDWFGVDREDERSFDSDDFPKVVFASQVEDDERCAVCGDSVMD